MKKDNKVVDVTAEVNVTAYVDLLKGSHETVLYDGNVIFRGATHLFSEEGKTVTPGFFRRLEHIADEVKKILVRETEDLEDFQREDVLINYESDTRKNGDDPRGYTGSEGSYLQRPLNGPEMEDLIKQVDRKIRPLFYKKSK